MKTAFKLLWLWATTHWLKFLIYSVSFLAIAIVAALYVELTLTMAVIYCLLSALCLYEIWCDLKPLVVLLLSTVLISTAKAEEPQPVNPGTVAVAGVVIVGGGYVIYRLAKFCAKKFPKSTNTVQSASYCAAWPPGMDEYCPSADLTATYVEVSGVIVSTNQSPVLSVRQGGFVTDEDAWIDSLEALGLSLSGPGPWFATNGHPGSAPVWFLSDGQVNVAGPGAVMLLEESSDLRQWHTILTTGLPLGLPWTVQLASPARQTFYRVRQR